MAKKKIPLWKYLLFGGLIAGIYAFLYANGLNLIAQYPIEIGGLAMIAIVKLAKELGIDLSCLLKKETKEKAGQAIIEAEEKGIQKGKKTGKKITGWAKHKMAVQIYKLKNPKTVGTKANLIIKTAYRNTEKKNPNIFQKEKR